MKKIIFVVGFLITSSMIVSGITCEKEKNADVLIYNGSGVWDPGIIAFEQFLEWKGLTYFKCDDVYIENNDLIDDFDVLFFPGGDFTQYNSDINSAGLQNIRDFISAGGGYLGICGGGYFACDWVTWRGQSIDMSLDIFNGRGYGPIEIIAPWLDYDMTPISMNTSHPINQYEPSIDSIVYYGGAAFYPDSAQNFEMIGTYNEFYNDISILDYYYGSGRVLLYGPHPEIEEDSARDDVTFADELLDLGTDWNLLWTSMDWLMDIPITEPPVPMPPYKPEVDGPGSGTAGNEYFYTFVTEDPEEEEMYYWVDWGDETNSGWVGPYISGETITLGHTWEEMGNYSIKCKAKDMIGSESNWSDPLPIEMPQLYQNDITSKIYFLKNYLDKYFPIFTVIRSLFRYLIL